VGLFGNGHGERLAELERLVATLTTRVVKAEATAAECAERAYRYMKKAEAQSRRDLDARSNQGQAAEAAPSPGTPPERPERGVWGARRRRALRGLRGDPALELNGHDQAEA